MPGPQDIFGFEPTVFGAFILGLVVGLTIGIACLTAVELVLPSVVGYESEPFYP